MKFTWGSTKNKIKLIAILIGLIWFWFSLPKPLFQNPYSSILLDQNGKLLQAKIASDGQWRIKEQQEVPEKFAQAIICFEDKRFYYHPGIDPLALGRAIWLNLQHRKVLSGGSTLSMQVIRISRNKNRTIFQKLIEMILTLRLEISYSKAEILSLYANHAPFGGNVVGLQTAAWRYFGRSADQLSWGEAASLAILPNSPSLVRPDKNRTILLEKRNKLLDQMLLQGIIDKQTCDLAKQEPIPNKALPLPNHAPNLLSSIQQGLLGFQSSEPFLKTTINLNLQERVNEILERHHQQLKANGINNAAALVMDVETGNVTVYAGNVFHPNNPEIESYVDMIPAKRSPGSTLKPLLYAAMLQDGLILPKTLLVDIPTQVAGYTPQNFDLKYDGAVPADKALARSLNIPAVRMLQQYRYERFYFLLKQLGIKSLNQGANHYGLSLILGGGENSIWEISGVYASLARTLNHYAVNSGRYNPQDLSPPKVLVQTEKKKETPNLLNLQKQFYLNAGSVYNTFEAMQELVRPGEEQLWNQFISSKRIAWKTGTSFGFRDGWAIGITPKNVVCVWVGNADGEGRPGLIGVSTAAPILFDIFKLLPNTPWFNPPYDDLEYKAICRESGNSPNNFCENIDSIWCAKAKATQPICQYHQLIHTDASGKFRVSSDCESTMKMQHKSWFVLPPAMEWYYRSHDPNYKTLPPWRSDCNESNGVAPMEMIYPKKSTKIYIPVELDGSTGKCVFEVAHRNKQCKIFWHLDQAYIGTTKEFHQLGLNPSIGLHHLVLVDENGERLELSFEVLKK
ncbi:MAG: penicillin-binding protein 1C [Bacteroidia bacterium]|nr:penicillin-binding protein 1C [Bacteroidia bacterium]MCF8447203.1 penicillin-binding protein 1C [Bacteroidia bacterium]